MFKISTHSKFPRCNFHILHWYDWQRNKVPKQICMELIYEFLIHWNNQIKLKSVSKALISVLKLMYKQIETYLHYLSRVKLFGQYKTISLLFTLKKLKSRNTAFTIAAYNFSTLYTDIPLDKLKIVMKQLINFCFKGGGEVYCQKKIQYNMDWH